MDGWVKDNLSELLPGTTALDLDGHRETLFDLDTKQPIEIWPESGLSLAGSYTLDIKHSEG